MVLEIFQLSISDETHLNRLKRLENLRIPWTLRHGRGRGQWDA